MISSKRGSFRTYCGEVERKERLQGCQSKLVKLDSLRKSDRTFTNSRVKLVLIILEVHQQGERVLRMGDESTVQHER